MKESTKGKSYLLLDEKIAKEYHEQALKASDYPLDTGRMRELKKELMDLCGITEIEAHNILCGRNTKDYIDKYTGRAEGRFIDIKGYTGEVQVVFKITEDERELFEEDR